MLLVFSRINACSLIMKERENKNRLQRFCVTFGTMRIRKKASNHVKDTTVSHSVTIQPHGHIPRYCCFAHSLSNDFIGNRPCRFLFFDSKKSRRKEFKQESRLNYKVIQPNDIRECKQSTQRTMRERETERRGSVFCDRLLFFFFFFFVFVSPPFFIYFAQG